MIVTKANIRGTREIPTNKGNEELQVTQIRKIHEFESLQFRDSTVAVNISPAKVPLRVLRGRPRQKI